MTATTVAALAQHPAPAQDAAGNDVWNVWAKPMGSNTEHVYTAYSYEGCQALCNALTLSGFRVLTDAI